jgi:AraC family transcriptional regulator, regulatory protein of adaptative response / methylated-DNA-[protein]-cysteine methyltransferase
MATRGERKSNMGARAARAKGDTMSVSFSGSVVMTTESLRYCFLSTSAGRMLLVVSPHGIRSFQPADPDGDARLLDKVRSEETTTLIEDPKLRREWTDRIEEVLAGEKLSTSLPLDLVGTPFRISVWKAMCEIPYGETRTYGEVAAMVGSPKAVRAVGSSCGKNRIAVIVPCHRVVPQGGELGTYFWGTHVKRRLLERERTTAEALVS